MCVITDIAGLALFLPVRALATLPVNLGLALVSFHLHLRGLPKVSRRLHWQRPRGPFWL